MSRNVQAYRYETETFQADVLRLATQIVEAAVRKELADGISKATRRVVSELTGPLQRGPARQPKAQSKRAVKSKRKATKAPKRAVKRKRKLTKAPKKAVKRKLTKAPKKAAKSRTARKSKR